MIADVWLQTREKALSFYSRFEDIEELLRTFIEDEADYSVPGVWDFGLKDSPLRLFYAGFAALECEQWDIALGALSRCREKAGGLYWKDRVDILSCIERGLERARRAAKTQNTSR